MGGSARSIRFAAFFFNEKYSRHTEFVDLINQDAVIQLTHPKYGILNGRITDWTVLHDDRDEYCQIDITFVEQIIGEELQYVHNVLSAAEGAFLATQLQAKDSFAAKAAVELGSDGPGVLTRAITGTTSLVSQLGGGISSKARAFVKRIDGAVRAVEGLSLAVQNPATSIITAIDYGTSLPGRVVGAVTQCIERYAEAAASVASSPAQMVANLKNSITAIKAAASGLEDQVGKIGASYAALKVAQVFAEDETARAQAGTLQPSFDIEGNYIAQDQPPATLTVNDLEAAAYASRQMLDEAYQADRTMTGLKEAGLALQRHVDVVKGSRERLKKITITHPTPLHAICLQNGLPYSDAERIIKINDIPDPARVEGEILIYA
jgi:prophage DNA circulation protein/urease gamma subunit